MIGKISTPRGEHVQPLLYYLFGPGRREEHTDPHIVAGWRHPADLEPPLRPDGKRDFTKLTGLLLQPQAALGKRAYARPVWHCSMRAAPEDRMLSDDEWAAIAHEVMHRTGLSPYGQEDEAVRWVAVRHGDDHIHLVAMLARQDGGKPSLSWERYKVRAACLAAEQRYGLRSTAPADRTAARRPTRAENEKAARRGLDEAPGSRCGDRSPPPPPPRTASRSSSPAWTRPGCWCARGSASRTRPGHRVLGRATRRHRQGRRPGLVRRRETRRGLELAQAAAAVDPGPGHARPRAPDLTAEERNALWDHATRVAADATAQIRNLAWTDPAAAADAAWATSDTLHVAAAMLGSRILRQAADAYDRAARSPYGRIPPPIPGREPLRQAARLLSAFAYLTGDRSMAPIVLITRLAALAEAVAELRDSQQHAAQAAAARAPPNASTPPPARHPPRRHPGAARQHCRPARWVVVPQARTSWPPSTSVRTALPRSRSPIAQTTAVPTATAPQPLIGVTDRLDKTTPRVIDVMPMTGTRLPRFVIDSLLIASYGRELLFSRRTC